LVFFFLETWYHYVVQAGLQLAILLPQPPKYWDYTYVLQHQAEFFLDVCTRKIYFNQNILMERLGTSAVSLFLNSCRTKERPLGSNINKYSFYYEL
jgi:hypothetical protein